MHDTLDKNFIAAERHAAKPHIAFFIMRIKRILIIMVFLPDCRDVQQSPSHWAKVEEKCSIVVLAIESSSAGPRFLDEI